LIKKKFHAIAFGKENIAGRSAIPGYGHRYCMRDAQWAPAASTGKN